MLADALPLFAAPIIAIDTETTGLEPASARIVEIAACGAAVESYSQLINPGLPIPPASTKIHGISDAMVAGAPGIGSVLPDFAARLADRLVIGHAVGFDLAVLATEAARAGVAWEKPRSLCVRTLAMIAAPTLANHSLDALAHWLGVTIDNRHRAAGDAAAAHAIFLKLVPLLEVKGIRTLAEAERASRGRSEERDREAQAGWVAPVGDIPGGGIDVGGDTYAYRHAVADLMGSPPVVVAATASLHQAMQEMVGRQVSSVFVADDPTPGQQIAHYGILTERDVLRAVAAEQTAALERRAGELASRPLHSIRAGAFAYRAIARMERLRLRHLAVRSDEGALVGALSARDLLRLRRGPALMLDDAIESAASPAALAGAWATLPSVAGALIGEELPAPIVARIVSEEIRSMTRRAAELAHKDKEQGGRGEAPAPFALLVLGSGGRGESLLAPDQDNALVFDAPGEAGAPGGAIDQWFADYAARLADILDRAGIPFCKGGVMAKNPQWRGSVQTWLQRIGEWVTRSRPEDLLNVDIFFDAVPVGGEISLGRNLILEAFGLAKGNAAFSKLLAEAINPGDAFNVFGGLRLEEGRIDLKAHGLFPIVALARTLALRQGVVAQSTAERLTQSADSGNADLRALAAAHPVFLKVLLSQQSADIANGIAPSNRLDPATLGSDDLRAVKAGLRAVRAVPDLIRDLLF